MSNRFLPTVALLGGIWASAPPAGAGPTPHAAGLERPAADFHPPPAAPPPDDPDDACAVVPTTAPDFSLEDVNPSSPTFGSIVPRTATPGAVTLLYIALASCGHCQADTDHLGALVTEQGDVWAEVSVRVIALNTSLEELPTLADGHDLPILVDNDSVDIEGTYGATRWYIYLLDRTGTPRILHYQLDFTSERDRLVAEVEALLAEARP